MSLLTSIVELLGERKWVLVKIFWLTQCWVQCLNKVVQLIILHHILFIISLLLKNVNISSFNFRFFISLWVNKSWNRWKWFQIWLHLVLYKKKKKKKKPYSMFVFPSNPISPFILSLLSLVCLTRRKSLRLCFILYWILLMFTI